MDHEEPGTVKEIFIQLLQELRQINRRMECLNKTTQNLGASCHKAFLQIRDAMTVLREDLSEASGTMIADTWLD